jgi:hypothetical protein
MPPARLPQTTWVRFGTGLHPAEAGEIVDQYRVEAVSTVRGAPLGGIEPGARFFRVESSAGPPAGEGDLVGATQHLGYTRARERRELLSGPAAGPDSLAVVIPITKSEAWWALAHDERDRLFRGQGERDGHVNVGRPYAPRLFRKLYHGRGISQAGWDFLTYFEFEPNGVEDFRALVAGLRDPERNPEWREVVRESEIWLRKTR